MTIDVVLDSPIFDDSADSIRRSTCPPRKDELAVHWSRSSAVSTLSIGDWDLTGSRVTLLSHASSSSSPGNGNDATPSPTSDFRCFRSPEIESPSSGENNTASGGDDEAPDGAMALPVERERKRKRKWKHRLAAGESNYRRLEDEI